MTLIIGMFYDNGSGALILSDSRQMTGPDYSWARKVVEVGKGVVFAASGYTGIGEKLIPTVAQARVRSRMVLPSEVINIFEDEMAELWRRYKGGQIPRFARDDSLLSGIIGFVDDGTPKLHCLHENGYAEQIKDLRAIGDGSRHAHNILKTLYRSSMSKGEALEIGIHAIAQVARVDAVVDSFPQIAVLEKGISPDDVTILNCDSEGKFHFECAEIDTIKKKVEGIEDRRTQAFRLLLNGSDSLVKRLVKVLEDYESSQPAPGETEEPAPACD
jgi:20S proteasome alpha/beta subunit